MYLYQTIFKLSLYLYPRSHRREYEDEMFSVFLEMLRTAPTLFARVSITTSSIMEIARWAPKEQVAQAETILSSTPNFVKSNAILSFAFIAPFFLVSIYNLHRLHEHEAASALLGLVIHTRPLYTAILPSMALLVVLATIGICLYKSEEYWHVGTYQMLKDAWHNCLLVLAGLGFLALAVLY